MLGRIALKAASSFGWKYPPMSIAGPCASFSSLTICSLLVSRSLEICVNCALSSLSSFCLASSWAQNKDKKKWEPRLSISFTLREGDLFSAKNVPVALSSVSASTCAFLLPVVVLRCSSDAASAKNSPKESQRKWFSFSNHLISSVIF